VKLDLSPWSRAMARPVAISALLSCLPPLAVAAVAGDDVWSLVAASVVSCLGLAVAVWTTRSAALAGVPA
jgi:hypothetical protein